MAAKKPVTVQCIVNNVWTSKGKLLEGESTELSPEEAAQLVKNKQVRTTK